MTIPEVRKAMLALAEALRASGDTTAADELVLLEQELYRRLWLIRTRRRVSRKVDDAVRRQIRELARNRPELTQMEISDIVGVNSGRVSETLTGFRT